MTYGSWSKDYPDQDFVNRVSKYISIRCAANELPGAVLGESFSTNSEHVTYLEIGCGTCREFLGVMDVVISSTGCSIEGRSVKPNRLGRCIASDMKIPEREQLPSEFHTLCYHHSFVETLEHTLPAKFPLADGVVDVIGARLSLHYFDKETLLSKIFPELKRLLKPVHGALVLIVKTTEDLKQVFHTRKVLYDGGQWASIIQESGFRIVRSLAALSTNTDSEVQHWRNNGSPWVIEARVDGGISYSRI